MIDPANQSQLKTNIVGRIKADQDVLNKLRQEVQPLTSAVLHTQLQVASTVAQVEADGADKRLLFILLQVQVWAGASYYNESDSEGILPTTFITGRSWWQLTVHGTSSSPLDRMMISLAIYLLTRLGRTVHTTGDAKVARSSQVTACRKLKERLTSSSTLCVTDSRTNNIVRAGCHRTMRNIGVASTFNAMHPVKPIPSVRLLRVEAMYRPSCWRDDLAGVTEHSQPQMRHRLDIVMMVTENVISTAPAPREEEGNIFVRCKCARGGNCDSANT